MGERFELLRRIAIGFMAVGVIGFTASFIAVNQSMMSWSAVVLGLGLALGFLREALRPKKR